VGGLGDCVLLVDTEDVLGCTAGIGWSPFLRGIGACRRTPAGARPTVLEMKNFLQMMQNDTVGQ